MLLCLMVCQSFHNWRWSTRCIDSVFQLTPRCHHNNPSKAVKFSLGLTTQVPYSTLGTNIKVNMVQQQQQLVNGTLAHSRMHSRQKLWSQASGEPTACDVRRAKQIGQHGQLSSVSPSLSDSSSSLSVTVLLSSVFTLPVCTSPADSASDPTMHNVKMSTSSTTHLQKLSLCLNKEKLQSRTGTILSTMLEKNSSIRSFL